MKLILASQSPRRQQLLTQMGYVFEVRPINVLEDYPKEERLLPREIAKHICSLKATAIQEHLEQNTVFIVADTIVCIDDMILEKPKNKQQAIDMLASYSNRSHTVITALAIGDSEASYLSSCTTTVKVRHLFENEILYYVDAYRPYDKAGGYGIQEWFGHVAVTEIHGSFTNVMGLPTEHLHELLSTHFPSILTSMHLPAKLS